MRTVKRIAKNVIALFGSLVVNSILTLVLTVLIARTLGDAAFGKYSFAIAFTSIFAVFSDLGYNVLLTREVAKDKSQAYKYLSNIITIRVLFYPIFLLLIVIVINLMNYPADTKCVVYLFGAYVLLTSFASIFRMIFRAYEKMEYGSGIGILINTLRVSTGILILFLGYGLIELGYVFLFAGVLNVLFSFCICRKKFVNPRMEIDFKFWKDTIKVALPLGIASIFGLIYVKIDTIMLSIIKGDAVVGWYNAAYALTLSFKPFPDLFMTALLPIMAIYLVSAKNSLKIVYEKSFRYLFVLGFPLATGVTLLADKIIFFFYGQQFSHSIVALQILAWDILLVFLYRCLFYSLISIGKQTQIMKVTGICALLNIVLNLFLIPSFSYVGAGIATIITESVLFSILFYISSKHICKISLYKTMIKPVVASLLMGILILILPNINFIFVIITSILFYFTTFYMIGGVTPDDKVMLKNIFSKKL